MRIAYVCADPGVPVFGRKGSSMHVQEVVRGFVRAGAGVELFATRLDGEVPPDLRDVGLHWLPALPKGDLAAREQASIGSNRSLQAALARRGPFDLVYERYSLWSFTGMEHARARGMPGLLEVNSPLVEEQARYRGLVDRNSAERVAQRVFAAASAILAVSCEVARHVAEHPGTAGKVHVVPNGVNHERFPEPIRPAPGGGPFTVGFVGTLKPWHGLGVLLDAFEQLRARAPDARLLVVGDGPEREPLQARSADAGLEGAVRFTGAVAPAEIPGLLASVHVAVAPYAEESGFYFSPLKLYEYMAAGVPTVASRVGQIAEIIEHERTGLLCPPGDASALASALDRLRQDPALGEQLGARAREQVLREHTWQAIVARILDLAGVA